MEIFESALSSQNKFYGAAKLIEKLKLVFDFAASLTTDKSRIDDTKTSRYTYGDHDQQSQTRQRYFPMNLHSKESSPIFPLDYRGYHNSQHR